MASYCSKCGKSLDDGTRYCPVCGSDTMSQGGDSYNGGYSQSNSPQHNNSLSQGMGGTLTIIFILGIIWGIISIILGFACFAGASIIVTMIGGEVAAAIGYVVGIISIVGGIIALLSCMKIYKFEDHNGACSLCLIGSIIALFTGGIIVGVVGIVFYLLLKKEGNRFHS